ncbi:hypothetical protein GQR58_020232 [Nymphon striatum]|nr:hypothetical protein GQR58_020232 [Nymphon striatum]
MFHINDGVVKHGVQSVLVDSPDTDGFAVKELSPQITSNAEKLLVSGLKKTDCSTFDEYRWEQYHNSKKELDFNQLVCCSSTIREHIKRAYLQCKMWLQAPTPVVTKPDPLQYGYEATDVGTTSVILPVSCRPDDLPPACKCPRACMRDGRETDKDNSTVTVNKELEKRMEHRKCLCFIWPSPAATSWAARYRDPFPVLNAIHSSFSGCKCWITETANTTTSVSTVLIMILVWPWRDA